MQEGGVGSGRLRLTFVTLLGPDQDARDTPRMRTFATRISEHSPVRSPWTQRND
jgi:hypothetical protein